MVFLTTYIKKGLAVGYIDSCQTRGKSNQSPPPQRRNAVGGRGHVAPIPLGDLDPWLLISLVFGVYGMTFEGEMRKLSNKFRIKLI